MTRRSLVSTIVAGTIVIAAGVAVRTQPGAALPVPGVDPARDVPNAHELPDPATDYKVVFDLAAPMKPTEKYAGLDAVARYLNTLAKTGVPANHRHIAIVFHQGSTDIVMNNDAFKARHQHDNPNIAMIQALKKAGVDLHVCGQAVLGRKIDPKTIQPEIQLDLWALTTLVNLQERGYVRVGGGS